MSTLFILFILYFTAAGPQTEVAGFASMAECEATKAAIPAMVAKADLKVVALSAVCSPVVPFGVPV